MIVGIIEEERRQDDLQKQLISWQTAHLMNATGNLKKRLQPSDLYKPMGYPQENEKENKPEQSIVKKFNSPAEKENYLQNLMSKFRKE